MPPCRFLYFQLNGHQEAAGRVGSPSKPRVGEPLPVFDSCPHVSPGGGDTDGMPTGGSQSPFLVSRQPLPHPALSPAPALVSSAVPRVPRGGLGGEQSTPRSWNWQDGGPS